MIDDREALRTWLALITSTERLKKSVDTMLRSEFGVTLSRFDVLAALSRAGDEGLRAGALTHKLKVTDGNTTQVAAKLIADGLIRKTSDPADGRVVIFRITKKGERLFDRMAMRNREFVAGAFIRMSEAQMRSMRDILNKMISVGAEADNDKDAA